MSMPRHITYGDHCVEREQVETQMSKLLMLSDAMIGMTGQVPELAESVPNIWHTLGHLTTIPAEEAVKSRGVVAVAFAELSDVLPRYREGMLDTQSTVTLGLRTDLGKFKQYYSHDESDLHRAYREPTTQDKKRKAITYHAAQQLLIESQVFTRRGMSDLEVAVALCEQPGRVEAFDRETAKLHKQIDDETLEYMFAKAAELHEFGLHDDIRNLVKEFIRSYGFEI